MNTIATTTRPTVQSTTSVQGSPQASSLRAATRRLVAWWSDDAVSAGFSSAREHDQRLLQRLGR